MWGKEMADFKADIADASQDLKTIEDFVNLPAGSAVKPRLLPSVDVGTLAGIRNAIFENGGLPAKPFKTKASMTASALVDGKYAQVTDDAVNNGLYFKESGVWVKSEYDPADTAIEKINENFAAIKTKDDILVIVDSNEVKAARIDSEGFLHLKHLKKNVQESLSDSDKVGKLISKDENKSGLFFLVDDDNNLLAKFKNNGELVLNGVRQSVQGAMSNAIKTAEHYFVNKSKLKQSWILLSSNDMPILRVDGKRELYIGSDVKSVNENIRDINTEIGLLASRHESQSISTYSKYTDFNSHMSADYKAIVDAAKVQYGSAAPAMLYSTKNDVNIGSTWINNVTFEKPDDTVVIAGYDPTYRADIGVVHPNVFEFKHKVCGYKYWMGINPYTDGNETLELPFIYGTNDPDLKDWQLIGGFPAPFEQDPIEESGSYRGHLSDSFFCYDPLKGDVIFAWRKNLYFDSSYSVGAKVGLLAARFDGVAWSDNYELLPPEGGNSGLMSPAIVYNTNDNLFYMYSLDGANLQYKTAPNLDGGGWSAPVMCNVSPLSGRFWHMDAKMLGGKVVVLLHEDDTMSSPDSKDRLYFAISSDFLNFTVSSSSITSSVNHPFYKASFLPIIDPSDLTKAKFKIIYTTDGTQPAWRLKVAETNQFNIGA